jgi:hypothetical protein
LMEVEHRPCWLSNVGRAIERLSGVQTVMVP